MPCILSIQTLKNKILKSVDSIKCLDNVILCSEKILVSHITF